MDPLEKQLTHLEETVESVSRLLSSKGSTTGVSRSIDRIVASQQEEAEIWLHDHVPAALVEMNLAAERIAEAAESGGHRQAGLLAQGLESLRRTLRALADRLSPAHPDGAEDRFGKECRTDEGKYLLRLHLALAASRDSNGLFEHDKAELDLFHQRLTKLNNRLASGVHGASDREEAEQLYSDVWRVISVYRRCAGVV